MRKYLIRTATIVAAWALLIAILPRPARQVAAIFALLAMHLAALLSCLFALCLVLGLFEKPWQRVQFTLRSLFILISVTGGVVCVATNFTPAFEFVIAAAFDEETIYSPWYSSLGWRRLRPGMSKGRVIELLGAPLTKSSHNGLEVWRYTTRGPSGTYYRREVHFSNDIVTEKLGELRID